MERVAIIRRSNKPAEGLETKSLTQEIIALRKEGFIVLDER